jgi:hypothetical protein
MAYVDDFQDELAVSLGLKEVTSGANVTLLEPYDAGVYYGAKDIDGVRVVSRPKVPGSNPGPVTKQIKGLRLKTVAPFLLYL